MGLFRNFTGDVTDPWFAEIVQRGKATTTQGTVKPVLNVYHFRRKVQVAPPDILDVISIVAAACSTALLATLNVRYTLEQWEGRFMDDPANATGVQPDGSPGAITGDSYDLCSAIYFLIRTGFRGRSFKGSKHYAPFSEKDVKADELLNDGAETGLTRWRAVGTMLNGLIAGLADDNGNTWFPCIVSRELSNLEATPAVFTGADWSEVLLNLTVGTMSRRKEPTKRDA